MIRIVKVVDDARASSLANTAATNTNFPQSTRPWYDIAAGWLIRNEIDHCILFFRREQFAGASSISGKFNDRDGPSAHMP